MYFSNQYLRVVPCLAASLLKNASSNATNEKGESLDIIFSALEKISCRPFFIFLSSASLTVNQRVSGSSPEGGAENQAVTIKNVAAFLFGTYREHT
jgi:hypothetical protein